MSTQKLFEAIEQGICGQAHFSSVQGIMEKFPQYDRKAINSAMLQIFKKNLENRDILFFAVLNVTENGSNKLIMKFMTLKQLNRDIKSQDFVIKPVQLNTVAIFADQIISLKQVVQKLNTKRKISIGKSNSALNNFSKNTQQKQQIDMKTVKNSSIKTTVVNCQVKSKERNVQPLPRKHPTKPAKKEQQQKQNIINRRKMSSSDEQYFDPNKPDKKAQFDNLLNGISIKESGKITPEGKMIDYQPGVCTTQKSKKMDIEECPKDEQDDIQALIAQARKKKQQQQKNQVKKVQPVAPKNPKVQNGTLNGFLIRHK